MSIPIACFIGWSNTGKTGFMEACTAELTARGVSAGAAKCVRHAGSFNLPGKDSSRFFQAGAEAALVSEAETVVSIPTPAGWNRPFLARLFPTARAVLVEGRLVDGAVRVLVGGSARDEAALKQPLSGFDVLVTGHTALAELARQAGLRVYAPEQFREFIDHFLSGGTMEDRSASVTISGAEVP
ncbi:MAG: molybdopterin-guanine dinucleotide biosynthesis protein MobB, partial [Spirochaetota bacterium]